MPKLLIGSLPPNITLEQIQELFSARGKVVSIIPFQHPFLKAPISYVIEMESEEDAKRALELNGNGLSVTLVIP